MLTRRGLGVLLSAGLLWGLGRLFAVTELYVAAVAAVALVAVSGLGVLLGTSTVALRRSVSLSRLPYGQQAQVSLELRNDARLPSGTLLVDDSVDQALGIGPRFAVGGLAPARVVTLRYPITGSVRGRHEVGPARIRIRDPFGLFERVRRYTSTDEVLVYPRVEVLADGLGRGSHRGQGTSQATRVFEQGDEFHTMREYVIGDDLRLVHWPSTAHRQRLMVRQQEQSWEALATVLCDTRAIAHAGTGRGSSLETAISAAASVVGHLADRRYELRLLTEADHRPHGVQACRAILDRLAELRMSDTAELAPALRRLRTAGGAEGLLVAIVAPSTGYGRSDAAAGAADLRALLRAGRSFTSRYALVITPSQARAHAADRLQGMLATSGWHATTVAPGAPVALAWEQLLAPIARAGMPR